MTETIRFKLSINYDIKYRMEKELEERE